MTEHTWPHVERSALITIDMQRDFVLPGAPGVIEGAHQVIPAIQRVLSVFRKHALPIVHVVRLYLSDGSNADLCRRSLIAAGKPIVAPGSVGAELVDELKRSAAAQLDSSILLSGGVQALGDSEWAIYKPRWGAFYSTRLERHLRELEVDTLVIVGCNFPNCPRTTVYEASERDFRQILVTDAVSGLYEQGARELSSIGINLMTSIQVTAWLSTTAAA